MKKLLLIFSLLLISQIGFAQDLLSKTVEDFRLALISGDESALKKLTHPKLQYGHSSGKVEDQRAFVESLKTGKSDFVTAEFEDQQITIVDNVAAVRHILSGKTNDNGQAGQVRIGVMLIWKKEGKDWLLLSRQAYKLPDNAKP